MICEKFENYVVDYLEGDLDAERTAELMAHVETCDACRDGLHAWLRQDQQLERYFARERARIERLPNPFAGMAAADAPPRRRARRRLAWVAVAAMLFIVVGVVWNEWRLGVPSGDAPVATLTVAEGAVHVLERGEFRPLSIGEPLLQARVLKVAAGGYAELALEGEGNTVEVKGGTQLALAQFADRMQLTLDGGQVWAHLATRPERPLVVRTPQLEAVARGTVFNVEQELGRTTVRVARGEVEVAVGATARLLVEGETFNSLAAGPSESASDEAVAWSRRREAMTALVDHPVPAPGALASPGFSAAPGSADRTGFDTVAGGNLAGLLPLGTRAFLYTRDWPGLVGEFRLSDYSELLNEPSLRQWWESSEVRAMMQRLASELRLPELSEIAGMLDGQIVMAIVPRTDSAQVTSGPGFLLVAECRRHADELTRRIGELQAARARGNGGMEVDPVFPQARVVRGHLIVTWDARLMQETVRRLNEGESTGFEQSDFYRKVDRDAGEAPFMAALDAGGVFEGVAPDLDADDRAVADFLGLGSLDYVIMAPDFRGSGMEHMMRLGFRRNRAGVLGWLGEPGPMRGLNFFSPDVRFFSASLLSNPRLAYYDLAWHFSDRPAQSAPGMMLQFLGEYRALLEAMGGEVVIGLENPILPIPNIKVVIEMRDLQAFREQFHVLVGRVLDRISEATGSLVLVQPTTYNGRTIYSIAVEGSPVELSWTYVDDFLVMGPGPRFVQHSIDVHDSGRTIAGDSRLLDLLPRRTGASFSMLTYQNIAAAIPDMLHARLVAAFGNNHPLLPDLSFLSRYEAPGIAYAYASDSAIDLYLNTPSGIDLNMGMAIPVVANWLSERTSLGARLEGFATARRLLNDLAVAAMVFEAENGRLPRSLDELVMAGMIAAIPGDPFGTAPDATLRLVVGPEPGTVTIYSIGPDQVDDGGRIVYDPIENLGGRGDIVLRLGAGASAAP